MSLPLTGWHSALSLFFPSFLLVLHLHDILDIHFFSLLFTPVPSPGSCEISAGIRRILVDNQSTLSGLDNNTHDDLSLLEPSDVELLNHLSMTLLSLCMCVPTYICVLYLFSDDDDLGSGTHLNIPHTRPYHTTTNLILPCLTFPNFPTSH